MRKGKIKCDKNHGCARDSNLLNHSDSAFSTKQNRPFKQSRLVRYLLFLFHQMNRKMNKMNYKTLGRSGLRVSPLCLGGMTFGEDWGWGAGEAESEKMIKRFVELGGNFIDT